MISFFLVILYLNLQFPVRYMCYSLVNNELKQVHGPDGDWVAQQCDKYNASMFSFRGNFYSRPNPLSE